MTTRIALVTGGMGGLGEAISLRLADAGYRVAVTCSPRNQDCEGWVARMRDAGHDFDVYRVDVADFTSCAACAKAVESDTGPIDILVNNAGITRDATMRKMSAEDWQSVLRTDLDSVFNMTRPIFGGMVARGWGRIINISSVNGSRGAFGQANYAAAKAGMHGFTKALALEVAKSGVTVNTVSPGYLATRMVTAVPQEVLESRILPQIPVGRLGRPDEVAALVAFLASDDAGFITGSNLAINGGMHME